MLEQQQGAAVAVPALCRRTGLLLRLCCLARRSPQVQALSRGCTA